MEKLVDACNIRDSHHDSTVRELKSVVSALPKDNLASLVYHKECYTFLTNKKTIDQIAKRAEYAKCLKPKPGRPKKDEDIENIPPTPATRRRSAIPYEKDKCRKIVGKN